jgi:uncharacterized membrane protein YhaH (DUF805 family)
MTFKQLYFSFDGRIGRKTFWLKGILPLTILSIIIFLVGGLAQEWAYWEMGEETQICMSLVFLPISLFLIWPNLAIVVKRWHDRDKSGWWILIGLIPIIGSIWAFVETGFLEGTDGPNRFGAETF